MLSHFIIHGRPQRNPTFSIFKKCPGKVRLNHKCSLVLSAYLERSRKQFYHHHALGTQGRTYFSPNQMMFFFFFSPHAPWHFLTRQTLSLAAMHPSVSVVLHDLGPAPVTRAQWRHPSSLRLSAFPPNAIIHLRLLRHASKKIHPWFRRLPPLCCWKSNFSWQLILHLILGLYLYHSIT